MTDFYVDPDFSGGTRNGTASNPWQSLDDTQSNVPRDAINAALATQDVHLFFAPRKGGGGDIQQSTAIAALPRRLDTTAHRLTLDGKSRYNVDSGSPSWADYTGANRFKIVLASGSVAIGSDADLSAAMTEHYVTYRGFEVTGIGARVRWKGSHTIVEDIYSHDITALDPAFYFGGATGGSCEDYGRDTDITIRRCKLERTYGEGIYIGGNYIRIVDGGCPSYGNTHSDILLEDLEIIDPGYNGAQGDAIDLKAGLQNVTIRRVKIDMTNSPAASNRAIVSSGVFSPLSNPSNFLVENCRLINTPGMVFSYVNGLYVRNCVLWNGASYYTPTGISTSTNDDGVYNYNAKIHNCTVVRGTIGFIDTHGMELRGNLLSRLGAGGEQLGVHGNFSGVDSDYNALVTGAGFGNWSEGSNSIYLAGNADIFADEPAADLHLKAAAAPIDAGVAISPGFNDYDGNARPSGANWDIGAYEYGAEEGSAALLSASSGGAASVSASLTAPGAPPAFTISNIVATSSKFCAVISWKTSVPASGYVLHGMASPPTTASGLLPAFTLNHSIKLTGLQRHKTYYYKVISTDASANTVSSAIQTFVST